MNLRCHFSIFLLFFCMSVIGIQSLDINDNSDEIEIYKHLFAKLNTIIDGNDAMQQEMKEMHKRIQILEGVIGKTHTSTKFEDIIKEDDTMACNVFKQETLCDIDGNGNGNGKNWTIVQRRKDGSENFYRDWNDYKNGFGNKSNEFFMGLEKLHLLTSAQPHELLVIMQDFDNDKRYAKYDQFEIGSEEEQYELKTLGAYTGNAGESLTYHKGSKFSTRDRDNDHHQDFNCAKKFQGAWWYNACFESHLNGCYSDNNLRDPHRSVACGIHWKTFRGQWYSLKLVEIMIRPKTK